MLADVYSGDGAGSYSSKLVGEVNLGLCIHLACIYILSGPPMHVE
jgi:hypothetical protein